MRILLAQLSVKRLGIINTVLAALILTTYGLTAGTPMSQLPRRSSVIESRATDVLGSAGPQATDHAGTELDITTQGGSRLRVEAVRITMTPRGFEPSEVTYPSRPFLLAVDNQAGIEDAALQLQMVVGNNRSMVHDFKLSLRKLRERRVVVLPPGQYELRETNHPGWLCRLTITQG